MHYLLTARFYQRFLNQPRYQRRLPRPRLGQLRLPCLRLPWAMPDIASVRADHPSDSEY